MLTKKAGVMEGVCGTSSLLGAPHNSCLSKWEQETGRKGGGNNSGLGDLSKENGTRRLRKAQGSERDVCIEGNLELDEIFHLAFEIFEGQNVLYFFFFPWMWLGCVRDFVDGVFCGIGHEK